MLAHSCRLNWQGTLLPLSLSLFRPPIPCPFPPAPPHPSATDTPPVPLPSHSLPLQVASELAAASDPRRRAIRLKTARQLRELLIEHADRDEAELEGMSKVGGEGGEAENRARD